jgi:outer membrane protein
MQDETLKTDNQSVPKNNLNTILTIINGVLLVGLVVLYFIILTPNDGPANMINGVAGKARIAYVNSDSILAHYDMVKSMRDELQQNTSTLESELKNKQAAFERDAAYFQDQVNKKSISEQSAQEIYGKLMNEQQKIYSLREQYSSQIAQKEFAMNQLLLDSLNNFLERYNSKLKFDYILSYTRGGSILTANDSLDITEDVIKSLNT